MGFEVSKLGFFLQPKSQCNCKVPLLVCQWLSHLKPNTSCIIHPVEVVALWWLRLVLPLNVVLGTIIHFTVAVTMVTRALKRGHQIHRKFQIKGGGGCNRIKGTTTNTGGEYLWDLFFQTHVFIPAECICSPTATCDPTSAHSYSVCELPIKIAHS